MDSGLFAIFLPAAIALVMFGLGLTLTIADFAHVLTYPRAAVLALVCQIVLLPVICLGLVVLFGIHGLLAVGTMLLVASPGGSLATLFSHLAGGDVALNVALTAVNSVFAVVTMPLVVGSSIALFLGEAAGIGFQPAKFLQVVVIVLVPVAIGMWMRKRFTNWADRMRTPVKAASVAVLALVIVIATVTQFQTIMVNIGTLGPLVLLLSALSLTIGYCVPRLSTVSREQSIASAMETGLHNGTLAITVAISVLGSEVVAIPAVMYSALMPLPAVIAAFLLARTPGAVAQNAAV